MDIVVTEEIRQDGAVVLSSTDGVSIPMIYNNLCGKNILGEEYHQYFKNVAIAEMGFKPGIIVYLRDGVPIREARIPASSH